MSDQVLYRFYSATGQLLYVGVTMNPPTRFKDHKRDKEWWSMVAGITVETYPDRAAVLDAECRAIKIEHPQYNVQHNSRTTEIKKPVPTRLVWTCDECHRPINAGDGYVWVSQSNAAKAMDDLQEWEDRARGVQFLTRYDLENIPQRVSWHAHHRSCDPELHDVHYWYDVSRLNTWEGIFDFLAHVTSKEWVTRGTDVPTLLRSIGRRFGKQ